MAQSTELKPLPYNAIVHEPPQKKSEVVFILVHHYGGNNRTLKRHTMLINRLGYTAISFELDGAHNQNLFLPPISKDTKWGLRFMWADRIEHMLRLFPQEKFIFTLSNPSNSMLDAVSRVQGHNVKGIICDGGPFFDIISCYWNLFTYGFKYKWPMRVIQLILGAVYWNPINYKKHTQSYIDEFGHKVPLLSLRAADDKLVPVESIDKCLALYPQNNLEQVLFKNTGHLLGLKLNKKKYEHVVSEFINKHINRVCT